MNQPIGKEATTPMNLDGFISSLQTKHATLEQQISEEYRRAAPNIARLKSLKVQKLRLKGQLHALRRRPANLDGPFLVPVDGEI